VATSDISELVPASAREGALLDRAFTRAAGAPLVNGNAVRLLKNAAENYPAWLEAIHSARDKIYFENYFICDDRSGREFAAALAERARAGVRVCLVYDWLGSMGKASRRFWRSLTDAGVEVRSFNPFRLTSPMDALHRDHRKVLAIDGRIGFVTGLCVGDMWVGDAARGIAPWRDTGVEVGGPAPGGQRRARRCATSSARFRTSGTRSASRSMRTRSCRAKRCPRQAMSRCESSRMSPAPPASFDWTSSSPLPRAARSG
jgi:phosphatidylserine/phosphatidylglycerophosphate/cardiolipin synthase-like enzyme